MPTIFNNPYLDAYFKGRELREQELDRVLREKLGIEGIAAQRENIAAQERMAAERNALARTEAERQAKQQDFENIIRKAGLISSEAVERPRGSTILGLPEAGVPQMEIPDVRPKVDLGPGFGEMSIVSASERTQRAKEIENVEREKLFDTHRKKVLGYIDEIEKQQPDVFEFNPQLKLFMQLEANGLKPPQTLFEARTFREIGANMLSRAMAEYQRTGDTEAFNEKLPLIQLTAELEAATHPLNPMQDLTAQAENFAGVARANVANKIKERGGEVSSDEFNRMVEEEAATNPNIPDNLRNIVAQRVKQGQPTREAKKTGLAGVLETLGLKFNPSTGELESSGTKPTTPTQQKPTQAPTPAPSKTPIVDLKTPPPAWRPDLSPSVREKIWSLLPVQERQKVVDIINRSQ